VGGEGGLFGATGTGFGTSEAIGVGLAAGLEEGSTVGSVVVEVVETVVRRESQAVRLKVAAMRAVEISDAKRPPGRGDRAT
jgi:hypothetical protein